MRGRHAATGQCPNCGGDLADLQRRIEDLRAFEREYRSRLRAYHQERLDELDAESGIPDD